MSRIASIECVLICTAAFQDLAASQQGQHLEQSMQAAPYDQPSMDRSPWWLMPSLPPTFAFSPPVQHRPVVDDHAPPYHASSQMLHPLQIPQPINSPLSPIFMDASWQHHYMVHGPDDHTFQYSDTQPSALDSGSHSDLTPSPISSGLTLSSAAEPEFVTQHQSPAIGLMSSASTTTTELEPPSPVRKRAYRSKAKAAREAAAAAAAAEAEEASGPIASGSGEPPVVTARGKPVADSSARPFYCGFGGCTEAFKREEHLNRHRLRHSMLSTLFAPSCLYLFELEQRARGASFAMYRLVEERLHVGTTTSINM